MCSQEQRPEFFFFLQMRVISMWWKSVALTYNYVNCVSFLLVRIFVKLLLRFDQA